MKKKAIKRSRETITKYVLKEELDKALEKTEKKLALEINLSKYDLRDEMNKMEERIDEKSKKYRDDVLTKIDGVIGELSAIREEDIVGSHQLRDHEKRIIALEEAVSSTP